MKTLISASVLACSFLITAAHADAPNANQQQQDPRGEYGQEQQGVELPEDIYGEGYCETAECRGPRVLQTYPVQPELYVNPNVSPEDLEFHATGRPTHRGIRAGAFGPGFRYDNYREPMGYTLYCNGGACNRGLPAFARSWGNRGRLIPFPYQVRGSANCELRPLGNGTVDLVWEGRVLLFQGRGRAVEDAIRHYSECGICSNF